MMGDRDYRQIIKNAIDSIGKNIEPKIDLNDNMTIHLHEVVRCIRHSYYDRVDPKEVQRTGFNDLLSGLLQNTQLSSKSGEFKIEDLKLKGQTDMMVDDAVIIFRSSDKIPETPRSSDILYLNSCLWIFDKTDGIIIYLTADQKEASFSLTRDKKIFEEVLRRVRVFNDLLKERKVPILEPSDECTTCQYYERCYINKKVGRSISIQDLFGLKKD